MDNKKIWLIAVALFLPLFFGCSTLNMKNINTGKLATEGSTIEAVDGSFTIRSGEIFDSPYQNNQFEYRYYIFADNLVNKSGKALEAGAQKVMVTLPYLDKKLYGVLFLGMATTLSKGPASRSYYIDIPEEYAMDALNGKISVVYERMDSGHPVGEIASWILWMSDQKFY